MFKVLLIIISYIIGIIKYQNSESAKVKKAFKKTYKTYPKFIVIENPEKIIYEGKINNEINKQLKHVSISQARERAIAKYGNGEMFKEVCFLGKTKYYPLVKYYDSFNYTDQNLLSEIEELESRYNYKDIDKKTKKAIGKVLNKLQAKKQNATYTVTECYYVCARLVGRRLDLKLIKVIKSFYDGTMIGEELREDISYESIINEAMWVNMCPFEKEQLSDEFLIKYLSRLN